MQSSFVWIFILGLLINSAHGNPEAHLGPLISGTSSYVAGTFVWTDYAYDDRGANSDAIPGGDATYPEDKRNGADIIQVQLTKNDGVLKVQSILQTLVDKDVPELVYLFDTDNNKLTGGPSLPGGAWLSDETLGVEWVLRVNSLGAFISRWNGIDWTDQASYPAHLDPSDNTISAEIPISLFNSAADKWRVFAVSGLASDSLVEGGSIFDMAFVVGELVTDRNQMIVDSVQSFATNRSTIWQDHIQGSVLAGTDSASLAAAVLDFSMMDDGATALASAGSNGSYTFLYKSDLDLDEGVTNGTAGTTPTTFYNGPYQPYLVYHRADISESSYPLVVWLHGTGQTHLLNTYLFEPDAGNQYTYPAVTVLPLGRGQALQYEGIGEYDILEVIRDVSARYPIDEDRIILTGFSMGGQGTYKLAGLYPDLFSTAIALFGTTSGGLTPLLQNLVNLPLRADNGTIDYLVNPALWEPDRTAALELGYDFRFFDINNSHHSAQPRLENCLFEAAIKRKRDKNPPRVRYYVEPSRFYDDSESGLKLHYNGAYWVSGMVVRAGADNGYIDALTLARPDRSTITSVIDRQITANGNDFCGPNPDISLNPSQGSEWRERTIVQSPGETQKVENGAKIKLSSLSAVTLDTERMSLLSSQPLRLEIEGDGITELTLLGDFAGNVEATVNGERIPGFLANENGAIRITEDFSGMKSLELIGEVASPSVASKRSRSGGGSMSFVFLGVLAVLTVLHRRKGLRC